MHRHPDQKGNIGDQQYTLPADLDLHRYRTVVIWCRERYMRELCRLQDEFEVAYARIVVVSVDSPEVQSAFRAGLGARFAFLSDAERLWLDRLALREGTDTLHGPYRPAAFTLFPDLTVHRAYNGYWYWGRATMEDLRRDMREITRQIRDDWEVPDG